MSDEGGRLEAIRAAHRGEQIPDGFMLLHTAPILRAASAVWAIEGPGGRFLGTNKDGRPSIMQPDDLAILIEEHRDAFRELLVAASLGVAVSE